MMVTIRQGGGAVDLPLVQDDRIAEGCVSVPAAIAETAMLGTSLGEVELVAAIAADERVAV
jgi:hypothetical protein